MEIKLFYDNCNTIFNTGICRKTETGEKAKGLTQGQLSKRAGTNSRRICEYERRVLVPTTTILIKLADALSVSFCAKLRMSCWQNPRHSCS